MSSLALFSIAIIVTALLSIVIAYKTPKEAVRYLKTPEGKRVLFGIVVFTLASILIAASSKVLADKPNWFTYGEVFAGIDYTKNLSPQCDQGGADDRATSNGGLRLNIYRSDDELFHLNSKYTHHSCAFSPDRESYDALGLEVNYKFFSR